MIPVYILLAFLPLCLSRALPANFVTWSKETSEFNERSINNRDLNSQQVLHVLDRTLMLDSPAPIIIQRVACSSYPNAISRFFTYFFKFHHRIDEFILQNGRVLYEFLRVINCFERSDLKGFEYESHCHTIFGLHAILSLQSKTAEEAKHWADLVITGLFSEIPNPMVSEANLEWILRMKLECDPSLIDVLSSTGSKILFWAHRKSDPFSQYLGMRLDPTTYTYDGKNVLGKLWMRVRDIRIPLYLEQWFADVNTPEQTISPINLNPSCVTLTSVFHFTCSLQIDYPIAVRVDLSTDPRVPEDFQRICQDGSDEMRFPTAGHLYQLVRVLRYYQSLGYSTDQIRDVLGQALPGQLSLISYSAAVCWAECLMFTAKDFKPPHSDLEWILMIKYEQSADVRSTLQRTSEQFILSLDADYLGMAMTDYDTYTGRNLVGKTWMKIRRGLLTSTGEDQVAWI